MEDYPIQSSRSPSLYAKRLSDDKCHQFEQLLQPISNSPCSTAPGMNDFESREKLQSRFPKNNSWMSLIESLGADKSDDDQEGCGKGDYFFCDDGFEKSQHLFNVIKIETATACPEAEVYQNNAVADLGNRSEDLMTQSCVNPNAPESDWISSVHKYSTQERRAKIAKYKAKLSNRRAKVPVARSFAGRSKVAKSKVRANGKFTRKE